MVRKQLGIVGLAVMVVAFAAAAQAVDLTVSNPSFETNGLADGGKATTTPSGWSLGNGSSGQAVTWNPLNVSFAGATGGNLPSPAAGPQALLLQSGTVETPVVYQFLSDTVQANKIYTLTTAIGTPLDQGYGGFSVGLYGFSFSTFAQTQLAYTDDTNATVPPVNGSGLFYNEVASFNSNDYPSNWGDRLVVIVGGGVGTALDNVRVTVTPEPGAAILLGTGALASLLVCVWRRRHRTK